MAFSLPRLPPGEVRPEDLQIWWQQVVEAIEAEEERQNELIEDLETAQAALEATQKRLNIGLSWTAPGEVLSATDAGTDATITVAAHTRVYADGGQSSIPGHVFTGLSYATEYGVYYDDPTLSNPVPAYLITTDLKTAQHNYADGRIMVGVIKTPAAAAPPTTGGNNPPGYSGEFPIP